MSTFHTTQQDINAIDRFLQFTTHAHNQYIVSDNSLVEITNTYHKTHINNNNNKECNKCNRCQSMDKQLVKIIEQYNVLKKQNYANDLVICYLKCQNQQLLKKLENTQSLQHKQQINQVQQIFTTKYNSQISEPMCFQFVQKINNQAIYSDMIDTFNPQQLKKILNTPQKQPTFLQINQYKQCGVNQTAHRRQFNLKEFKRNTRLKISMDLSHKYSKISSEPSILLQQSQNQSKSDFKLYFS